MNTEKFVAMQVGATKGELKLFEENIKKTAANLANSERVDLYGAWDGVWANYNHLNDQIKELDSYIAAYREAAGRLNELEKIQNSLSMNEEE